jgi:hypothetical protein
VNCGNQAWTVALLAGIAIACKKNAPREGAADAAPSVAAPVSSAPESPASAASLEPPAPSSAPSSTCPSY